MTQPSGRGPDWPAPHPPQYTVEGEIHMIGEFASGAARTGGWRGAMAKALVLLLAVMVLVSAALVGASHF